MSSVQGSLQSFILLFAFLLNSLGPFPDAQADDFILPKPGNMIQLSHAFNPPILKGIKVHPENPFKFDFILDQGDDVNNSRPLVGRDREGVLKAESTKLIKYFLASLTVPEKDLWVNLSPYEKNRIIPQSFGQTEMGRDLLAEDYMLKQITASLIYPEGETGKKFWKRVYEEAAKKFGTTNIPVNTFNKVWIVPEKAVVFENAKAGTAYVVQARLKVMLEEDYLSLKKHHYSNDDVASVGANIVREIVIPDLTKEVNQGKNFGQLRQVYNSLILASWYKKKIKDSILAQVYENKNKVAGVNYDSSVILRAAKDHKVALDSSAISQNDVEAIYHRYLQAFKKGAYNYIKEELDPISQKIVAKKYFSGGFSLNGVTAAMTTVSTIDPSQFSVKDLAMVVTNLAISNKSDKAMSEGANKSSVVKMSSVLNELHKKFFKKSADEARDLLIEEIGGIEHKGQKLFSSIQAEELIKKSGALQRVAFSKVLGEMGNEQGGVLFEDGDLIEMTLGYPIFRQTEILEFIDWAKDEKNNEGVVLFDGTDITRMALNVVPAAEKQALIEYLKENTNFTGHDISRIVSLGKTKKTNIDQIKVFIGRANTEGVDISADSVVDVITSESPEIEMDWALHRQKAILRVQGRMAQLNEGLKGIKVAQINKDQRLGDIIRGKIGEVFGEVNQIKEGRKTAGDYIRRIEKHEVLFTTSEPLPAVETEFGHIDLNRLNNIAAYDNKTRASDILRDLWIAGLLGLVRIDWDELASNFGIEDFQIGQSPAEMLRSRRNLLGLTSIDLAERLSVSLERNANSLRVEIGRWENGYAMPDLEESAELSIALGFRNQSLWIQIVKKRARDGQRDQNENFKNLLWQARIFKGFLDRTLGEKIGVSQGSISLYQDNNVKTLPTEEKYKALVRELGINDAHPLGITPKKFRDAYDEALGKPKPKVQEEQATVEMADLKQLSHDELIGKLVIPKEEEFSSNRDLWMMNIVAVLQQRGADQTVRWVARLHHPVLGIKIDSLVPLEQLINDYVMVQNQVSANQELKKVRQSRGEGRYIEFGRALRIYVNESGLERRYGQVFVRGNNRIADSRLNTYFNGHGIPSLPTLARIFTIFGFSPEKREKLINLWKLENRIYVDEETFGSYLSKARARKGFSRKQVAEATGFHENVIRSYELQEIPNDQKTLDRLPKLVGFLGLDPVRVELLYRKAKIAKMMRMQLGQDFTNDTLGAYILNARINSLLSPSELAKAAGFSSVGLFKWENDYNIPRNQNLNALASALKGFDVGRAKQFKPVKPVTFESIGSYVRYGRIKMGLTQTELANAIGVGMRAIVQLEGENVIIKNRVKFAALIEELQLDEDLTNTLSGIKSVDSGLETIGSYFMNGRMNKGLTRNDVIKRVNMKIGTLKNIELGTTIPRYDWEVMDLVDFLGLNRERAIELLRKAREEKEAQELTRTNDQKEIFANKKVMPVILEIIRLRIQRTTKVPHPYETLILKFIEQDRLPRIDLFGQIIEFLGILGVPKVQIDEIIRKWAIESNLIAKNKKVKQMNFGERINYERVMQLKSISRLAKEIDLNPTKLREIELNERKISPDVLDKLAQIFDIDAEELKLLADKAQIVGSGKNSQAMKVVGSIVGGVREGIRRINEKVSDYRQRSMRRYILELGAANDLLLSYRERYIVKWADMNIYRLIIMRLARYEKVQSPLDKTRMKQIMELRVISAAIRMHFGFGPLDQISVRNFQQSNVRISEAEAVALAYKLGHNYGRPKGDEAWAVRTLSNILFGNDRMVEESMFDFLENVKIEGLEKFIAYWNFEKQRIKIDDHQAKAFNILFDAFRWRFGLDPRFERPIFLNLRHPKQSTAVSLSLAAYVTVSAREDFRTNPADPAMLARESQVIEAAHDNKTGGIDFSSDKALTVQNNGQGIQFHIDPAMLAEFQNTDGFVPVIINIQPLVSLSEFLGI